jgi:DNA-binding GntR family transcriptional regulator
MKPTPIWHVPTLTDAVADWIASGIVSGRWSAGDRLREIEVCEELGTSRAPVREALRALHEKGLVRLVPRIGAVVNQFSTETVMDVYELRAVIERWICEQSVPALEGDVLDRLDEILAEMRERKSAGDYSAFFDLGWKFRTTLYSGATNSMAMETVDQLRSRLHSLPQVLRQDDGHLDQTLVAYQEMADAARRGDAALVGSEVYDFMMALGARVCERFMETDFSFPIQHAPRVML